MNKYIALILPALLSLSLATGCSDSDVEVTTSGECVMTAATLGTLSRTLHTTSSSGADSTYKVSVVGSLYPMSIDHLNGRIYNLDSLPVGTNAEKVVFATLTSTGTRYIRSLSTGKDTIFSASDSTDFSKPRLVTIYGTDGISNRTYLMEVRVHQEWGDSTTWNLVENANADVAAATALKAVVNAGSVFLFAKNSAATYLLSSPTAQNGTWTRTDIAQNGLDVRSIQVQGGYFYALVDGKTAVSSDGINWNTAGLQTPADVQTLLVGSSDRLTAIAGEKIFSSKDGGVNWEEDEVDYPEELPDANAGGTFITSTTDSTYEDLIVVGTRNGAAKVWKRNIDLTGAEYFAWNYYPIASNNNYACPVLKSYNLMPYDNGCLLIGETSEGHLSNIYLSRDKGRTWYSTTMKRPDAAASTHVAATVHNNYVIVFCAGSGEIWRGKINRLDWKDIPTSFK